MKKTPIMVACTAGALALVLSGCGGTAASGSSSGAKAPLASSTVAAPGESAGTDGSDEATESSFKDGVLTTPDMRIEITRHKVIPAGKKGNEYGDKPVVAFWYKTTNVSGKKVDPMAFIMNVTAYQDNNPNAENKLDVGMSPDDKLVDGQMESIKKGGTVESAIAYELDDLKTPVDLVASTDLGMTEIGKVTYTLK